MTGLNDTMWRKNPVVSPNDLLCFKEIEIEVELQRMWGRTDFRTNQFPYQDFPQIKRLILQIFENCSPK